jgi:hypothetical protein
MSGAPERGTAGHPAGDRPCPRLGQKRAVSCTP